jgi:hypothetical protein
MESLIGDLLAKCYHQRRRRSPEDQATAPELDAL